MEKITVFNLSFIDNFFYSVIPVLLCLMWPKFGMKYDLLPCIKGFEIFKKIHFYPHNMYVNIFEIIKRQSFLAFTRHKRTPELNSEQIECGYAGFLYKY